MSSVIECVSREFKEKCNTKNAPISKFTGLKKFKISVQCIKKNMNIYEERKKLFDLCKKHGIQYILCPWDINFDIS